MSSITEKDAFAAAPGFFSEQRKDNFIAFLFGGIRRSAVLETFAFFSATVVLNLLFGDGARFIGMNPHPFWIIVLLVIVQYGQREAIFTALLATAFLLVGNMPEQSLTETMYDYYFRIFLQPLLWIIMALLLGSIRSRQFREREDLFERLWKSEESAHILARSYLALKKVKERLEMRLAEEKRSVLTVYRMAKSLQSATPKNLNEKIEMLVTTSLHPRKFSFFRREGSAFVLAKSFGWSADDAYATRYNKNTPLNRDLFSQKRLLSVTDEEQEKVLGHEGMLAGPVYNEKTGAVLGFLKIEEMDFIDMGVHTFETFKIVCEWIAFTYLQAPVHRAKTMNGHKHQKRLAGLGKPLIPVDIALPKLQQTTPSEISNSA